MEKTAETLRIRSWNVAGKAWCLTQQAVAIAERQVDIVALQEVRPSTAPRLVAALAEQGLPYALESASNAGESGRRYGVLLASRWPLECLPEMVIPYPERVLSAVAATPWGAIEIYTAHIPPGAGNGWKKIETFEGIYQYLTSSTDRLRILCGDFNSPQHETVDGQLITWGQRICPAGTVTTYPGHNRWDAGKRSVLEGLRAFDLPDVFRAMHGYAAQEWSWRFGGRGQQIGRRFDHIFASHALHPIACDYLHDVRKAGWSDHAAIEAVFKPGQLSADTLRRIAASYVCNGEVPPRLAPRPAHPSPQHVRPGKRSARRKEHPLSVISYARDVRDTDPDRDGRCQAQFVMGWRKAVAGESMQATALERLTWQNLGYRLGTLFGETSPGLMDELYAWCARQQAATTSLEEHD